MYQLFFICGLIVSKNVHCFKQSNTTHNVLELTSTITIWKSLSNKEVSCNSVGNDVTLCVYGYTSFCMTSEGVSTQALMSTLAELNDTSSVPQPSLKQATKSSVTFVQLSCLKFELFIFWFVISVNWFDLA